MNGPREETVEERDARHDSERLTSKLDWFIAALNCGLDEEEEEE